LLRSRDRVWHKLQKIKFCNNCKKKTNDVISVGKRIRRPVYFVDTYYSRGGNESTCEIQNENVTQLNFSVALPDNSSIKMAEFSVFLEGNLAKKVKVKRGSQLTFSVPLNGSKNFAIKVENLQGISDYFYFLKYEAK
jgi:hypothetical protein